MNSILESLSKAIVRSAAVTFSIVLARELAARVAQRMIPFKAAPTKRKR